MTRKRKEAKKRKMAGETPGNSGTATPRGTPMVQYGNMKTER